MPNDMPMNEMRRNNVAMKTKAGIKESTTEFLKQKLKQVVVTGSLELKNTLMLRKLNTASRIYL